MNFAPAPPANFEEFIGVYFERCRERVPEIQGNAGKWTLEDLIPGLSDFDTRFFVVDTMKAADWCRMSTEVGRVHLELAQERQDWARNLEHLPGVNLRWNELFDPGFYFTEFSQWSFYHGDEARLEQARQFVTAHQWTERDELYHWEKLALYYGSYNRSIDPAINLAQFENKYPLHSRTMHYLAPPLHSAVCLMQQRTTPGKLEALRRARELFPNAGTMALVLSLVDRHYEAPEYLQEPGLTELDNALDRYLTDVVNTLLDCGAPLDCPRNPSPAELKAAVADLRERRGGTTISKFFENVKFSRLMKGRLWFYGQKVLWFDSEWLIRNELNRMHSNFYETPLRLFARFVYSTETSADAALERMRGEVLDADEVEACRRFAELAARACGDDELKQRALEIAARFDPFLCALEKITGFAQAHTGGGGARKNAGPAALH